MAMDSILWRRLDTPGHDACRLHGDGNSWRLDGAAVFAHQGAPARLVYDVTCNLEWQTQQGRVRGWLGTESLTLDITRTEAGAWSLNGETVPHLDDCFDLDLGFTPATNLLPVRRLALEEGEAADAPAAWLDLATRGVTRLHQRYERRGESVYWYEAPSFDYAAPLDVTMAGFVRQYPGLWEAEL